ncbi:dolichyl-P-Man:Man(5)GlcNAc(2)-PP-dolichol alpha-1,3-mannosyltransferase, partial [Podochytrium sp. JEL0797]
PFGGVWNVVKKGITAKGTKKLDPDYILLTLFTSNLIGITFARSLHYQFYSWYFYTIPYLLFRTDLPVAVKLAVFVAIEYAWNVFPSTVVSSGVLFACHVGVLVGLWCADLGVSGGDGNESGGKKVKMA